MLAVGKMDEIQKEDWITKNEAARRVGSRERKETPLWGRTKACHRASLVVVARAVAPPIRVKVIPSRSPVL